MPCDRDALRNLTARTYLESQVFRALSIPFANTFCGHNIFHIFVDTKGLYSLIFNLTKDQYTCIFPVCDGEARGKLKEIFISLFFLSTFSPILILALLSTTWQ